MINGFVACSPSRSDGGAGWGTVSCRWKLLARGGPFLAAVGANGPETRKTKLGRRFRGDIWGATFDDELRSPSRARGRSLRRIRKAAAFGQHRSATVLYIDQLCAQCDISAGEFQMKALCCLLFAVAMGYGAFDLKIGAWDLFDDISGDAQPPRSRSH